ncbi:MAG: threonylcarbamoyl-AMP synthase [Desulfofustis sp. PB-SRB1]|jgi:tRNA threonylcarbamoyl adenosine modification protein (Sua5/YciO/YrdC/YwlC family)|nr:threonylcarbamoyl-AMP synthase [Desulfofustis sp. PB-SRB1]MBM1000844.1 threonylcarbamoyl-AMP synthase [Desulfofustis sp. PB-SRB1]HBH28750.1 threonylcarbamoyl-AMP synthase [Desulfofustis sp.]HBH31126.1 threonylcarbamoyl-AMP synthase [Desulfofustis sp.]
MTKLIAINPDNPQPRLINQVAQLLAQGMIICYPTDTGYGIGCDIFNAKAVRRIVQLKKRPASKPFSFMCSDLKNISHYAHVSNTAYRLLKKNLPGSYTFILPGTKLVPKIMTTRQKTVGIRVPANTICRSLLAAFGAPLVNTSIMDTDDEATPHDPNLIELAIGNQIDLIIDGGEVMPDPSSIIDLTGPSPEIIRVGKGDVTPFQ